MNKRLTTIMVAILLMIPVFSMPIHAVSPKEYSDLPIIGETYHATYDVLEDGRINVDVKMDVMFNQPHHGIYVTIPNKYNDVIINDKKHNFEFPVTNINIYNDYATIDSNREGVVLKIGSGDEFVEGLKHYNFSYTINMRDVGLEANQLFYQNIIADNWDFPINKLSYDITMPHDLSHDVFLHVSNRASTTIDPSGTKISGSVDGPLYHEAVTIETLLPKDYFEFPNFDRTWQFLGISVGITIIAGIIFISRRSKNDVVETVEFTAPNGISSGEVGYIYRGYTNANDVVSFIVYWASKEYLMLEELDKKGNNIQITKLKELDQYSNREELRLFNALFKKGDVINTKTLNTTFGNTVNYVQRTLPDRFRKSDDERVFDRNSIVVRFVFVVLASIGIATSIGAGVYSINGMIEDAMGASFISFIAYFAIAIVGASALSRNNIYSFNRRKTSARIFLAMYGFMCPIVISFMPSGKINITPIIIAMLLFLITLYCAGNMANRTQQGNRWYGQIVGLKRFIEVAEKDRLIALVEETPQIFYDVLPYAYVLGVTDIWIKKFESIAIQPVDWYRSSQPNISTWMMMNSLNRSMQTVSRSMVSVPAPKAQSGGGGKFGGGGGFSGGGGGFAGGGFGGTGGGGW